MRRVDHRCGNQQPGRLPQETVPARMATGVGELTSVTVSFSLQVLSTEVVECHAAVYSGRQSSVDCGGDLVQLPAQRHDYMTLAERLARLFDEIRPQRTEGHQGRPYSSRTVVAAIKRRHPDINVSPQYLAALRNGTRLNPSDDIRTAL